VLASVAVSASAGSWTPQPAASVDPQAFSRVSIDSLSGTAATTALIDPASRSGGPLWPGDQLVEPGAALPTGMPQPVFGVPQAGVIVVRVPVWHHDAEDSWYGPTFYGKTTACGQVLTETLIGVAHRSLPCGTLVTFRNPENGETITVPVVDRGPYVSGRTWDLTKGTCTAIGHCWTGPLDWRIP